MDVASNEEREDEPESIDELEEEGKSAAVEEALASVQVGIYNEELYPVELQWGKSSSSSVVSTTNANDAAHAPDSDVYQVSNHVYFHKAVNLGGVAGMVTLQQRWFVGEVVKVVAQDSGFCYCVCDKKGEDQGQVSKSLLRRRVPQWQQPLPES